MATYGVVIEPIFRLRIKPYALTPPGWPRDFPLRIAIVADPHICDPWMSIARLERIVSVTNDLGADCILMLGDYVATHKFQTPIAPREWSAVLAKLRAPLGVHAVLGNHDWWSDFPAMRVGEAGIPFARKAMEDAGIRVYQNDALRLAKDGRPFWLAGLGDQLAFVEVRGWRHPRFGIDDLAGTMKSITDDAPVILMAHEPDIFPQVPARAALTVCGHTHGGQVSLFGWTPIVPSRFGTRYVYGHKVEEGRHVVVSGGLGCSVIPVRMGSTPEIVLIDLGRRAA